MWRLLLAIEHYLNDLISCCLHVSYFDVFGESCHDTLGRVTNSVKLKHKTTGAENTRRDKFAQDRILQRL